VSGRRGVRRPGAFVRLAECWQVTGADRVVGPAWRRTIGPVRPPGRGLDL